MIINPWQIHRIIYRVKESDQIYFDILDYNFIVYPNITELKQRLEKRLKEYLD